MRHHTFFLFQVRSLDCMLCIGSVSDDVFQPGIISLGIRVLLDSEVENPRTLQALLVTESLKCGICIQIIKFLVYGIGLIA